MEMYICGITCSSFSSCISTEMNVFLLLVYTDVGSAWNTWSQWHRWRDRRRRKDGSTGTYSVHTDIVFHMIASKLLTAFVMHYGVTLQGVKGEKGEVGGPGEQGDTGSAVSYI